MVRLRLDRRLQGRLDPADVLQEAYLDVARCFPKYTANPALPFFLWVRLLTGQRLVDLHRQHLGAKMRNAGLGTEGCPGVLGRDILTHARRDQAPRHFRHPQPQLLSWGAVWKMARRFGFTLITLGYDFDVKYVLDLSMRFGL
jgi:hypothetical protein